MTKAKKYIYAVLCVAGTVLPYAQFIPWAVATRFDVALMVRMIASSHLAAFGWLDVVVSALALFVLIFTEGREDRVPLWWLPIIGTLTVGVSLGLPLYLLLREVGRERVA